MSTTDLELAARIESARRAAGLGAVRAREAEDLAAEGTENRAIALTSIALSLSAMATVLLATLDEEAR